MFTKSVVFSLLAITLATSERHIRQPDCPGSFRLTSNPCQSGQGRIYYPVPGDDTKFVQCDTLGRAYVVQCPTGLVYDQAITSCQTPAPAVTTKSPASDPCAGTNPSTSAVYVAFPGENTKFYECLPFGQMQVLQCPPHLEWNQIRTACIYVIHSGTIITTLGPTPNTGEPQLVNPCTAQQLATGHFYFAHPHPTQFIQCDATGHMFTLTCPSGLIWNQYYETCTSSFVIAPVG